MDQLAFREFVKSAVLRAVPQPRTIGRLTLTQTERNDEPKLREPEMRHALAQVAEGWTERYYGIEVPTEETYRFVDDEGDKETAARHDFAVYSGATANADRLILLELKKDQPELVGEVDPDCPKVRKDFQKLIVEGRTGGKACCISSTPPTAQPSPLCTRSTTQAFVGRYTGPPRSSRCGSNETPSTTRVGSLFLSSSSACGGKVIAPPSTSASSPGSAICSAGSPLARKCSAKRPSGRMRWKTE